MTDKPLLSVLTLKFLDRTRHRDYFYLAFISLLPSLVAVYIGAGQTVEVDGLVYVGWFDKYNFWPFVFVQPFVLWNLRFAFARVANITPENVPDPPPPLVVLFRLNPSKQAVYTLLRDWLSSPKIMGGALLVSLGIHIADLQELVSVYMFDVTPRASEMDWSLMYQSGLVTQAENIVLCVFAYIAQFIITTMGIIGVAFLTAHNLFFLNRIYQRSRVKAGDEINYITLDLDDVNRCFGFRAANGAFNTQVWALSLAGIVILMSRFANVRAANDVISLEQILQTSNMTELVFFPDIAQFLLAIGWFLALIVIASPALVKLVPRLPFLGAVSEISIDSYLREFLVKDQWPSENPTEKQINHIAAKFARQGFWPTGDNRASHLFFFSFWVFLVILYPIHSDDMFILVPSLVVSGAIAYGMRTVLLKILSGSLAFVDERLIDTEGRLALADVDEPMKIQCKVFISYRREDSLAYARLIQQGLSEYMEPSQLFMDLSGIHDGVDFVDVIESAIQDCDVLIAIIGERWASCTDASGQRRLTKQDDFVRLEIATALRAQKKVIPVLVGNASMPKPEELPDDLSPLWRRHARDLSDSRWEYDVGELSKAISETA